MATHTPHRTVLADLYVSDRDLADFHKRADAFRENDKSLSDAITDLIEDMQRSRSRLATILLKEQETRSTLTYRDDAIASHERYVRETYDLCNYLLTDAEEKDEAERAADERDRRHQLAVGQ